MRKYYTNLPICPNCLEPANNSFQLVNDDNPEIFCCPNCGSRFKNFVELNSKENSLKIKFPLFSEINLNAIEKSYIDWILNENYDGKYFVTWPWEFVKFIPILLAEYLYNNQNDKIIIFYHLNNNYSDSELDFNLSLDSIYVNNNFDESSTLKMKNININDIFERNMQGYCKIFVNSLDSSIIERYEHIISSWEGITPIFRNLEDFNDVEFALGFADTEKSCFFKFLDEFKSFFGGNSIKKIDCCGDIYNLNNNSIFELVFYESYSYGSDLIINDILKKSFSECYNNKFKLVSPFSGINYCFIDSQNQLSDYTLYEDYSIIFIDSEMSSKMLEFVNYINPNLIISADIDRLFGKKRYNPSLLKLLSSNYNMLLFSTNLNRRSFYKIGSQDNFLKKRNFTIHTFDHLDVLNQIIGEDNEDISLFSSNNNNIYGSASSLSIKLESNDCLKDMDDCLEIFDELFSNNYDIHKYIEDLIRTPLLIGGEYQSSFSRPNLNIEYLLDIVFNSNKESWQELNSLFEKVYGTNDNLKNPLLNRIIELINEYDGDSSEIAIIVNHFDIKKLKNILNDIYGENTILVTKWNELNKDIKNSHVKYGIATEFPTLTYNLYNSPLDEVKIIGSPQTIEKFEIYKNNRLTNKGTKPLYLLADDEKSPSILKNALNSIDVEFNDIDEYNEKVNEIIDDGSDEYGENVSKDYKKYNEIKKGTNVILVSNFLGQSMIIPFDREFGILDNGIDTLTLSSKKSNYDELLNKDIIINNPLNLEFFKFVIENGENIIIKHKNYIWQGFKELIESMFEWMRILQEIINKECLESSKPISKIKKDLVENIKKCGVNAQTASYIKSKWLSDPYILETTLGNINIYNSEKPWDEEDIYKIYSWISKDYPDLSVPLFEAYKTYGAAEKLQEIRLNFFKNRKILLDNELKQLNNQFQEYVSDKFNQSDLFNVEYYMVGKVKRDVKPYKILEDYSDYFEEIN